MCNGIHSVPVWTLGAIGRRDGFRTNRITVHGSCCWEISNRHGEKQLLEPSNCNEYRVPGMRTVVHCNEMIITPSIDFIFKVEGKECDEFSG